MGHHSHDRTREICDYDIYDQPSEDNAVLRIFDLNESPSQPMENGRGETVRLVNTGLGLWQRQGYVNSPPAWWLIGAYLLLSAALLLPGKWRSWRLALLAGLVVAGWLWLRRICR